MHIWKDIKTFLVVFFFFYYFFFGTFCVHHHEVIRARAAMARKVVQAMGAPRPLRTDVCEQVDPTCCFENVGLMLVKALSEGKHLLHQNHTLAF